MSMDTIENVYYEFLCEKVEWAEKRGSDASHYRLLKELHKRPFVWSVPNDDNRATDGKHVRDAILFHMLGEYYDERKAEVEDILGPTTVLEMLVALAERMNDVLYSPNGPDLTTMIFIEFLENLGVYKYDDANFDPLKVNDILTKWLERRFQKNGKGSIFPLNDTKIDSRITEIWYQMNEYILEKYGSRWGL